MNRLRRLCWCLLFCTMVALSGTAALAQVPDTCQIDPGDFCTFTQGGWGQDQCRGQNVACIRNQYWYTVFPNGTVTIGGHFTIRLTSPAAVANFLPSGTTPGVLTQNYLNPTFPTSAGVFAAQTLTLKLNVAFGDAGVGSFHDLGDLLIATGPFEGYTVDELLALCNTVLGGNLGALPPGTTVSMLSEAADRINNNFDNCNTNGGYLERECLPVCNPPVVECWSGNPASFTYGQPLTACAVVADPNNDVESVVALYTFGTCTGTVNAAYANGRWCVTIPATCTATCADGRIIFRATDACDSTGADTCHFDGVSRPPVVACWTGNPATYTPGQSVTVCATVNDPDNNVTGVTARYVVNGCDATTAAIYASGRWCVTIPASCTQSCGPAQVTFTAIDACGLPCAPVTCTVNPANTAPVGNCWSLNPTGFTYGQPVTMCYEVTDAEGNLQPPVLARYVFGDCTAELPAVLTNGRWCVTVPAACTDYCGEGRVIFTATDACGLSDRDTCRVYVNPSTPVVDCWPGNPVSYTPGQPVTVCATVFDADHNVTAVTGRYTIGGCDATLPAVDQGGGRWCVTVPGQCLTACEPLRVIFTATDACTNMADDTCWVPGAQRPPAVACWDENPLYYGYGQPLTLCALIADPDNNLDTVTATYTAGDCTETVPATSAGNGRWCVTIPETCTTSRETIEVIFTATDACGASADDTCYALIICEEPTVLCLETNPVEYAYGQPLTVCADVYDTENDVDSIRVRYYGELCDVVVAPLLVNGHWCVTIPASCTESYEPIHVVVTAYDRCQLIGRALCDIPGCVSLPPTIVCAPDNPPRYTPDQPVTLCAIASDPDLDIVSVTGSYVIGGCVVGPVALPAPVPGRWCLTVPAACMDGIDPLVATFVVTDRCSRADTATCVVIPEDISCRGMDLVCWDENPWFFRFGEDVTVCAVVDDPFGEMTSIQCVYRTDLCEVLTVPDLIDGRYCVTVPGSCTEVVTDMQVIFLARDRCDSLRSDTCTIPPAECMSPSPVCWEGNPAYFVHGQPVHLCVDVQDTDGGLIGVTAHVSGELCEADYPVNFSGGSLWCLEIPAACTGSSEPIVVTFTVYDQCALPATVTCTLSPPVDNECCFWCAIDPAFVSTSRLIDDNSRTPLNAVIDVYEGQLRLAWSAVPDADYYLIFSGALDMALDEMDVADWVPATATQWVDPTGLDDLADSRFYQVAAYRVQTSAARVAGDRARWEFNEGVGDTAHDHSGFHRDAWRWPLCPPDWGAENDVECDDAYTEYVDFDGVVYTPDRCIEHLRAENDTTFYRNRFQVWARVRLESQPTIESGPYYIISTHSLSLDVGGGFALRIDPGWVDRDGVREYHNRLTGLVWDRDLNGGLGGFRSIISPMPTLDDTTTNSVPLNQWSCISMIVDGTNSMLLIDGRVVAAGNLRYRSDNNGVPVIIGAGYRHHTFPIEYPFYGDLDCLRITDLP